MPRSKKIDRSPRALERFRVAIYYFGKPYWRADGKPIPYVFECMGARAGGTWYLHSAVPDRPLPPLERSKGDFIEAFVDALHGYTGKEIAKANLMGVIAFE